MRIYDELGNLLDSYDEAKGYLKNDSLFVCQHEAVEAVEEQGHFVTIAEYPNGGKDVEWVVDVPAVEAKEAWDEYEDIYRYIPYTEEELAEKEAASRSTVEYRIAELEEALVLLLSGVTE